MKKNLIYITALYLLAIFNANAANILVKNTVDSATPINGDHTLRSALAAAVTGDIITFDPSTNGTPFVLTLGSISIQKEISLKGNGIQNTILDGNQTDRIFIIGGSSNEYFVSFEGIMFQNGYTNNGGFQAGGAMFVRGSLYLKDCKFYKNKALNGGGGAFSMANLSGHQPNTFINVQFVENEAGGSAVMIGNMGGAPTNFDRCSFIGNTSQYNGGAFTVGYHNTTHFMNCKFKNNSGDRGGALSLAGNVKIFNSIFTGNTSTNSGNGGAIANANTGWLNLYIANSTIAGNTATGGGGGISFTNNGGALALHLYNNIIAKNQAILGATHALYKDDVFISVGTYTMYGGNFIGDASGGTYGLTSTHANDLLGSDTSPIDPLFVDLANDDAHLQPCSPAINLATSIQTEAFFNYDINQDGSVGGNISVDYDENPRTVNTNTDAGAYEYQGTVYTTPVPSFHYTGNAFCQNSGTALPSAFNPGGTYTVTGANASSLVVDANTGSIDLNASLPGNYTVQYSVPDCNGGTNSHSETITINPSPVNTINATVCAGESYTLGCDTYTQSGTYTHTTTTPQGCPSTTILNLTVAPSIQIYISQQINLNGGVARLTAWLPTPPLGTYTYSWAIGGQKVSITNFVTNPCSDKVYTLTVTDTATGCYKTTTYSFTNRWNMCRETIDPHLGGLSVKGRTTQTTQTTTNTAIYPNPSNGNFTLQSSHSPIVRYEIYNSNGKMVQNKKVRVGKQQKVNMENAPAGLYMVRVYTKDNQVLLKRIVIK
ncbi:T9SS type A sorting domain-containing protein [Microscilla marina]|uniref:Secretion system C-terminal sorting domain-containing protein n=1 Tax=Microscilla marina ATCC 23134 TaxID=313606 RepID=A1ZFM6_MICM2|nr:T9SS type A sorting domain-containing protein [Microscilla marina]EAY30800.1 conserved hypothetical protein [Microscilla marina ATCC 23134]